MKSQKSKKQQSRELAKLTQDFVESGGEVKSVPSGTSGNINNSNLFSNNSQIEPKSERTPLNEVVQTLEERKRKKTTKTTTKTTVKTRRKKLIVDDFGDPVRWVWEE